MNLWSRPVTSLCGFAIVMRNENVVAEERGCVYGRKNMLHTGELFDINRRTGSLLGGLIITELIHTAFRLFFCAGIREGDWRKGDGGVGICLPVYIL